MYPFVIYVIAERLLISEYKIDFPAEIICFEFLIKPVIKKHFSITLIE